MSQNVQVAILMGSASDLTAMSEAARELKGLGVPFEVEVTSAHRTPDRTAEYVREAEARGVKVFVVGAGMAAHLAGAVAANTTRPVIGVPLPGGVLDGLDALLATVQMPKGIPVATTAVGKAGAGKRIDAAATAIWNGMTVEEITSLDLAYAPPFSPVWDPLQIATRRLTGMV